MCPLVVLQSECGLQNGKKERCPSTSFPWTPNLSETLQRHVTDCYDRWYFWTGPSTPSVSENSVNLSSLRYVIVKHVVIRQWGCQTAREPKPALYFTWGAALSHTRSVATSHQYRTFSQASFTLQSASALRKTSTLFHIFYKGKLIIYYKADSVLPEHITAKAVMIKPFKTSNRNF